MCSEQRGSHFSVDRSRWLFPTLHDDYRHLSVTSLRKPLCPGWGVNLDSQIAICRPSGGPSVERPRYPNNRGPEEVIGGPCYLPHGHRQPVGHEQRLIRPTAPLWCERLSGLFDSLLLSQQEVVGDNWHRISLLTSGRLCGLKWQRSPKESGEQIRRRRASSYLPLLRNRVGNGNMGVVRGPAARCSSHLSEPFQLGWSKIGFSLK